MSPRPKPLIGVLLGMLLGVVVVALLTVLGITPPDRLPLFGILALSVALTATLTTLVARHAAGRYVTALVLSALCAGVALTGIPEYTGSGSAEPGCHVAATSSLEPDPVRPGDTSALDPFDMTTTDTVAWTATTDAALDEATPRLSLMVGGFAIPVWNGQDAYNGMLDLSGEDSVEAREDTVRDTAGVTLTGTYHLRGTLASEDGVGCEIDAYLRVQPDGTFSGLLILGLWVLLAVVVILIAAATIATARSLGAARRARPTTDTLTTTGGTSVVEASSGSIADGQQVTTGEPPAQREGVWAADAVAAERAGRTVRGDESRGTDGPGRGDGDRAGATDRSGNGKGASTGSSGDAARSPRDVAAEAEEPAVAATAQGPTVEEAAVDASATEPTVEADEHAGVDVDEQPGVDDDDQPGAERDEDRGGEVEPDGAGSDAGADPDDPARP